MPTRRAASRSGGRSCTSMSVPLATIVARSMTLRSSRTLPGQSCRSSACMHVVATRRRPSASLRCVELADERLDEQRQVVLALAQRRQPDARRRSAGSRGPRAACPDAPPRADRRWSRRRRGCRPTARAAPPSGRNVRSCSTRSSLACVTGVISAISSRKSVPRLASSKQPARRAIAPVNAPFSWPKSSRLEQRIGNRRAVDRRRTGAARAG